MSKEFQKFIPFAKVDEAKREVYGIVTAEVEDKVGETCHYDSTKEEYKAWSAEFVKATEGNSCGNLREMHQLKAAGRGISLDFNDSAKEILMGFKVTDDDAWKKVQDYTYTGFSQGGFVKRSWKEGKTKYYTAAPSEVSLVDNPCLGVCHFAYIKADGAVEMRKARTAEIASIIVPGQSLEPNAERPLFSKLTPAQVASIDLQRMEADPAHFLKHLGTETFAKELLALAAAVKGESPAAAPLQKDDMACSCKCEMCMKCTGMKAAAQKAREARELVRNFIGKGLKKGMYDVARFAELINALRWLYEDARWEAEAEADESPVPQDLLDRLNDLCAVFLDMAEEEVKELLENPESLALASFGDVRKTAQRLAAAATRSLSNTTQAGIPAQQGVNTMSDLQTVKAGLIEHLTKSKETADAQHAQLISLLEKLGTEKAAEPAQTAKAAPAAEPAAAAAVPAAAPAAAPAPADLAKSFQDQFAAAIASMNDQFKTFMEQLAPPKAASGATAVTKAQDNGAAPAATEEEPVVFKAKLGASVETSDEFQKAMKSVFRTGGVPLS